MRVEKVEFRCPTAGCGKLLFKIAAAPGAEVETRCTRCRKKVTARLTEGESDADS